MSLAIEIAGIRMKNPIMPASGTFGYGEEFSQYFDLGLLGAFVSKGTTLEPRAGNAQPRIIETPCGMINSIGLENPGIEVVIKEKIPFMAQFGVPIIINVSGSSIEEYIQIVSMLDCVCEIAGLEINISCPNVEKGGMLFGSDPKTAHEIISTIYNATDLPLIVKLTPNVTDIVEIAQAVVSAGADAVSLINTVLGSAIVNDKIKTGGLSGSGIKPIALNKVYKVCQNVNVPVIGMGGITNLDDALGFIKAGAHAVAIGTANFSNPLVMVEVIKGLEDYCKKNNTTLEKIRGTIQSY